MSNALSTCTDPWPTAPKQVPQVPQPTAPGRREPVAEHIARTLALVQQRLPLTRRVLHAGEAAYRAGDPLQCLVLIHSGIFKTVNLCADGREQVVGLHFRGDWLGFDGIADARHGCDAVAMDVGEVWCVRYDAVMQGCAEDLSLMALLNSAMSRQIMFGRDSMLSLCTLSADARVADFLRYWSEALAERGLRNDQIMLRMTRAEIGNYLGMKLETVSRALSRLAREGLIRFTEAGRRELQIPDVSVLAEFVQRNLNPASTSASAAMH
jgi:CRP/FNR family transcriptional regulator